MIRRISAYRWGLVALSGVLQVLIFPIAGPLPEWRAALAWFAVLPLIVAILPSRENKLRIRDAALLGYGCGVIWYLGSCYWVYGTMHDYGGMSKPLAALVLVLFCLYLGLYHAMFAALLAGIGAGRRFGVAGALVAAPCVWVATELARARITSFPWDLLGYSQVDNALLLHLAPWAGVYLISFLIVAASAAMAAWWLLREKRWAVGGLVVAVVMAVLGWLHVSEPAQIAGTQTAVLMQPNLNVGADTSATRSENPLLDGMRLTMTPETRTVTLWPESPAPYESDDPALRQALTLLASRTDAPLMVGGLGVKYVEGGRRRFYNSAMFFDPDNGPAGRYDKIHLVPFGEYVPFASVFAFASGLTQQVGTFERGVQRSVFHSQGHAYGPFLCYESIFADEVRQFTLNGAEVLVNLSDDGWYGDSSAPFQHLNMARMRAVENHRWVLRDTNTGITAAIDPAGRVMDVATRHAALADTVRFNFLNDVTFYTEHGDLFAYVCALLTLAVLADALLVK